MTAVNSCTTVHARVLQAKMIKPPPIEITVPIPPKTKMITNVINNYFVNYENQTSYLFVSLLYKLLFSIFHHL